MLIFGGVGTGPKGWMKEVHSEIVPFLQALAKVETSIYKALMRDRRREEIPK